ncbi:hypothetical protein K1T71_004737 [Dendrolimus kikuchii]|uniref:Uncharacterized protein n=1 Tax=Dendrolimus kikuchii TaxID=765133 RepID=A0ACC1D8B2_9NEOP|nr:hypothetical protein K1T71_004737 [Dendrolimus kikuchii]
MITNMTTVNNIIIKVDNFVKDNNSALPGRIATPAQAAKRDTRYSWLTSLIKMHCFICVTYMIILTSANPTVTRELSTHKQRSLFRDVIESLRLHAKLPEVMNRNEDNNLAQNYDRFEYENEPELRTDTDYLPRRNDRLEMPGLKYRFPKDLKSNGSVPNKEIVVYINTESSTKKSTEKPKATTVKVKKPADGNDYHVTNKMAGQSQIGDRKTETIIRPVVVVNIHGFSDAKIMEDGFNITEADPTRNYFNIKQEINLERGKPEPKVSQEIDIGGDKSKTDSMKMCDNSLETKEIEKRKFNGVLEILFSI